MSAPVGLSGMARTASLASMGRSGTSSEIAANVHRAKTGMGTVALVVLWAKFGLLSSMDVAAQAISTGMGSAVSRATEGRVGTI